MVGLAGEYEAGKSVRYILMRWVNEWIDGDR